MTRFPAVGGGSSSVEDWPYKNKAETFTEPDVTVSDVSETGGSKVVNETIELGSTQGNKVSAPSTSVVYDRGRDPFIVINPNKRLEALEYKTMFGGAVSTASIWLEDDTGTTLASDSNVGDNTSKTFNVTLEAGREYTLYHDDGDVDHRGGSASFPYEDPSLDVVAGGSAGSETGDWYMFDWVRGYPAAASGEAAIEWPQPSDVFRWDAVKFQTSPDGESVEVFIEEDDGTGWTEIAGPVSRGDPIDADPDSEIRFRVKLSRTNLANNPTLDAIYRRWVV
ncbi:hypothetical protein [Halorubrum sp. Boch-26]|uniref:hypothetical protein n=1 Tax=Halorubrum sp. Boch-26 TaxID=2994426 RepID=UPI002469633E|nr:hypothetical protein [Halorubrum sp. Boch-26]